MGELAEHAGDVDRVARRFHEVYETLAPTLGYETREDSAVPWDDVPETNKRLMRSVVDVLATEGTIVIPMEARAESRSHQLERQMADVYHDDDELRELAKPWAERRRDDGG